MPQKLKPASREALQRRKYMGKIGAKQPAKPFPEPSRLEKVVSTHANIMRPGPDSNPTTHLKENTLSVGTEGAQAPITTDGAAEPQLGFFSSRENLYIYPIISRRGTRRIRLAFRMAAIFVNRRHQTLFPPEGTSIGMRAEIVRPAEWEI